MADPIGPAELFNVEWAGLFALITHDDRFGVGRGKLPTPRRGSLRRLEDRVRELERQLGRKTLEVEMLKEALDLTRSKKLISLSRSVPPGASQ
jgi:hypothetical protein